MGFLVVTHALSCPSACGIPVPQPAVKPASPALEGRFLSSESPGKFLVLLFFFFYIIAKYELITHCGFDLAVRDDLVMLSIFSCAHWPSVCLLRKNVYSDPLPF